MKDYYSILGVPADSSATQIKKAFRKAAKDYHPDVTGGDKAKEARFKEISEAYEVLGDQKQRVRYDALRARGAGGMPEGFEGFGGSGGDVDLADLLARMRSAGGRRGRGAPPMEDLFGGSFGRGGGVGDMFGEVFRDGFPPEEEPGTVHAELEVDFVDAAIGGTRKVSFNLDRPCPECGGRGGRVERCPECGGSGMRRVSSAGAQVAQTCPRCAGRGVATATACARCGGRRVVQAHEELEVRIPPGVDDGSVIRLRGKGPAVGGGAPGAGVRTGDLLLRIKVRPHPRFRREGQDVVVELPITVEEAILGATIEVPTLDGHARVRIPPGTSSGQRFRLRGKGARRVGEEARGDQYVRVAIVVPKEVDQHTAELVRELGRRAPVKPDR
ncbi:MAG: J domain-containing protein [Deltaproteobacteria bacterium]|nr:J domain-containing protein [Deltaproteobacteria bacterium]